jgi:hypothetical protein
MSDEQVEVPFGDDAGDTAVLLLAAAEDLGLDPGVVKTNSDGSFVVPKEVADKADGGGKKKAAKKTAAKKTAAKKATPAKKAEAKPEAETSDDKAKE